MVQEFAVKTLLLYFLLVTCAQRGEGSARKMSLRLPSMNELHIDGKSEIHTHESTNHRIMDVNHAPPHEGMTTGHADDNPASSHMDHMLMVFLFLDDLKVGKKMPIYFPKKDPSQSPQFLPREEANAIPFSYSDYPQLLNYFSFSPGSPQAKAMENTLKQCEAKAIEGETKTCATSLESMLDFVRDMLGRDLHYQVLSTTHLTRSSVVLQNYTILETPREIPAPKLVACHTMPYPYAIFYCHRQTTENKVFVVSLEGDNGDRVEAVALCHLDTSKWNRDHVAFQVLRVEPGATPVCHFFPEDNLVYVPSPSTSNDGVQ